MLKKSNAISNWLLFNKKVKLVGRHKLETVDEAKEKKYCKWNDVVTHDTFECIVFRDEIEDEIDKKNIMFLNCEDINVIGVEEPFKLSCNM